ncbi:hypothetical protein L798_01316 [Zootermopsis nevadensis]|uniref:Uncharacterized protein n=1 Tax=Zootermopsis nevadensis TaxID=136037 RepID=A0A067QU02_ZOONE|nr:hypothetical protein L798_01316 [Zootermopsis nevadensis]
MQVSFHSLSNRWKCATLQLRSPTANEEDSGLMINYVKKGFRFVTVLMGISFKITT